MFSLRPGLASVRSGFLYYARMARMPKLTRPTNLMDVLLSAQGQMNAHGHALVATDIAAVHDALRTMLTLTASGDVLFADELRNILNIKHSMPARRGTSLDPMVADRLLRRMQAK
jgi:hypothetical protein